MFFLKVLMVTWFLFWGNIALSVAQEVKFPQEDWDPLYLYFIDKDVVEKTVSIIDPPPLYDEPLFKKEMAYLEIITKARTEKQKQLFKEIGHDPIKHFVKTMGLDTKEFENVQKLFYHALARLNPAVLLEKWRYQRARPYQISKMISLYGDKAITASYPSLYAAQAWMLAHLMSQMYPEYDYIWSGWAKEISMLYEVMGLQFPSDSEAGKTISFILYDQIKKDIVFKNLFLNADIELIDYKPDIKLYQEKFGVFRRPQSFP